MEQKKAKKGRPVNVRLPLDLQAKLDAKITQGAKQTDVIVSALKSYLRSHQKQNREGQ